MNKMGNNLNSFKMSEGGILESAMLVAPFPVVVFEGIEQTLAYANNALYEFLGKDENIIGKTLLEVLPELESQPFPKLLKEVFLTGQPYSDKEAQLYLLKEGRRTLIYCDYSYTAIKDEEGSITGVLMIAYDITNKVLARKFSDQGRAEALEKQTRLEMALETGRQGYYELELNTGALKCTSCYKANLGLKSDAAINAQEILKAILPSYHSYLQDQLKEALANHQEYNALYEVKWPDGSIHWLKECAYAKYGEDGQACTLLGVTIDVTEERKASEKQAMLASIVSSSDDTILSKTLEGIITSWNAAAERMFGYTENEAVGKHISLLIPPSRIKEEDMILGSIVRGEKIDHFETIRITKDGKEIPISLTVSPIKDKNGKIIGASKIARDITESKKAEEKQAMLAAIVNSSEDTIVSKTLDGIITSWNAAAEKMFGYTATEAIGRHISLLIPKARLAEEDVIINNIRQGKRIEHFETIRQAKDGREIPISLTVSPIKDKNGKVIGASKIARDISGQKQAQEALRQYTENLETINSIGKAISEELDLKVISQKVTDATTRLTEAKFGVFLYNTVDEKGKSLMLYALSGAPKEAFEKFGTPQNTAIFNYIFSGKGVLRVDDITQDPRYGKNETQTGIPGGHLPVASYMAVPVISKDGTVIGGLFFGHPEAGIFTEAHEAVVLAVASQAAIALDNAKLYEEIKQLNKKKDEFIGLASHELKTPLTSINGYLQILKRKDEQEGNSGFVDKAISQVDKLTSLVSGLLDVSKIEAGKLQMVVETTDMELLAKDVAELVQLSNQTHEVSLQVVGNQFLIKADALRIEQVMINLITNAIKYSPQANQVIVSLIQTDTGVKVGVKDFGFGIPESKWELIFSRFYRIDGVSPHISGLGIGLFITKEIIERHNGKIWLESKLDEGTTFWFTLPYDMDASE